MSIYITNSDVKRLESFLDFVYPSKMQDRENLERLIEDLGRVWR